MGSDIRLPSDVLVETDLSGLALSTDVIETAAEVCEAVELHPDLPGSRPQSIAASAVYLTAFVMNEKRDQHTVAKEFGTTGVTVHNNYPEVAKIVDSEDIFQTSLRPAYEDTEQEESSDSLVEKVGEVIGL